MAVLVADPTLPPLAQVCGAHLCSFRHRKEPPSSPPELLRARGGTQSLQPPPPCRSRPQESPPPPRPAACPHLAGCPRISPPPPGAAARQTEGPPKTGGRSRPLLGNLPLGRLGCGEHRGGQANAAARHLRRLGRDWVRKAAGRTGASPRTPHGHVTGSHDRGEPAGGRSPPSRTWGTWLRGQAVAGVSAALEVPLPPTAASGHSGPRSPLLKAQTRAQA